MPINLSIKNAPDDLVERLRQRAKRHHRSLQGELLAILEEAVGPAALSFEEAERRIKAMRLKTGDEATTWLRELRNAC